MNLVSHQLKSLGVLELSKHKHRILSIFFPSNKIAINPSSWTCPLWTELDFLWPLKTFLQMKFLTKITLICPICLCLHISSTDMTTAAVLLRSQRAPVFIVAKFSMVANFLELPWFTNEHFAIQFWYLEGQFFQQLLVKIN